jgi:hypothetical protein
MTKLIPTQFKFSPETRQQLRKLAGQFAQEDGAMLSISASEVVRRLIQQEIERRAPPKKNGKIRK